jgi:hypothetical protein
MSSGQGKKDPNGLPYGWDVRVDKRTNRIYFMNHELKSTSWEDPRPLPRDVEMKKTADNRIYFVNHVTRKTTWDDPRPRIIVPSTTLVPVKRTLTNSTDAKQRQRKDVSGRVRGRSLDKEWYSDVVRMSLVDKTLTTEESALLVKVREKLSISESEHDTIVRELGWSAEEIQEAKKQSESAKECVVCLAAPATHVVMDCMHVCLCADCSMQYNGIYRAQGCPSCRAEIKEIRKTY